MDSGTFQYHNKGIPWFCDLGTETYNCHGFWSHGTTRYRYYVMKPEGNNTITISSDPKNLKWGQDLEGIGFNLTNFSGEFGSYATFDMTDCLGNEASFWRRGVLVTNDRKTTVIQDELVLVNVGTVHWVGHFGSDYVSSCELSDDGTEAYLKSVAKKTGGKVETLRVKLIDKNTKSKLKFEIKTAYDFLMTDPDTGTFPPEYALTHGTGVGEKDRSKYSKLVVSNTTTNFNIAVVIEVIDEDAPVEVGYKWTPMEEWEPVDDTRKNTAALLEVRHRGEPNKIRIKSHAQGIIKAEENGLLFNSGFDLFYERLAEIQYITDAYPDVADPDSNLASDYDTYLFYRDIYDEYMTKVNKSVLANQMAMYNMLGII